MKRILPIFAAALFALPVFAQEPAAPAADAAPAAEAVQPQPSGTVAEEAAETPESVLDRWTLYLKQGGKTMWFIGLLSVLGLGCALERFWNLRRSRIVPAGLAGDVVRAWREGAFGQVEELCAKNRSVLARVVETMLEHRDAEDFQAAKTFAEDKAGRELRLEGRKAAMLATVATLAPLLGLFGTVLGLLEAFGTVAAMGEMGDASVLADSIGKALVTTVAGLAVAMPALFVHGILRNRLALYSVMLEEEIATIVSRAFAPKR
ncbi:MAG: MotA/TolQ/ExbB proton channel family protein [Kiritimatiellae bacterium]|nr:MotA/TolQ/ExbB proton channel family protein [Kiritimatiellia bacterium]